MLSKYIRVNYSGVKCLTQLQRKIAEIDCWADPVSWLLVKSVVDVVGNSYSVLAYQAAYRSVSYH